MDPLPIDQPSPKPPWKPKVSGVIAVLFGPLAGALVALVNLKRLGEGHKGRSVLGWTIAATVPLVAALIYLPGGVSKVVGLAVQGTGAGLFPWLQKRAFERWQQANPGAAHANEWKSAGWGLLGMVFSLVVFAAFLVGRDVVVQTLNQRGEQFELQEQFAEAEKQFRLAARLDPDDATAHLELGELFAKQEEWNAALAEYRIALRMVPRLAEAHLELGDTLRAKGDVDGAVSELREAVRLKPDLAAAHAKLGGILLADKDDAQGALREFREVVRLSPGDGVAHCVLAGALLAAGQPKDAIEEYKSASRLGSNIPLCKQLTLSPDTSGSTPSRSAHKNN
jgi:Flp pilus assembly protein TadD